MNENIPVCIVTENEAVSSYDANISKVEDHRIVLSQFEGKRKISIPTKKITSIGIMIHN